MNFHSASCSWFRKLLFGGVGFLLAVVSLTGARASRDVSVLAPEPDWASLEPFQETITREEFLHLLNKIYLPRGGAKGIIDVGRREVVVRNPRTNRVEFRLRLAPNRAAAKPAPVYWKPAVRSGKKKGGPLAGVTIALDPGHIGGRWAKMEERWFQIGDSKPVMEGEMVLTVGRHLEARLKEMGAKVVWVRSRTEPVTSRRPKDLRGAAVEELRRQGVRKPRNSYNGPNDPNKTHSIQWQSELLFYRMSEIRARAERVNGALKPDAVVCLHFNAEAWGNPADPQLVERNHLHMLPNGNYFPGELRMADIRYDLMAKILSRSGPEELALNDRVAASLAKATGLPPYTYGGERAVRVTESPYVWARNLLANRLYHCPVIYCEPYVMNSREVFQRIQMGDYEGTRNGRKSIFREYADAVADGLAAHYGRYPAVLWAVLSLTGAVYFAASGSAFRKRSLAFGPP